MDWNEIIVNNWPIKLVSAILILAAWIDGQELKVPNWITFPMVLSGLMYSTAAGGFDGFLAGLTGMCCGLICLLPLYAVGGMGAGDVKLMAGIGAWVGWQNYVLRILRIRHRRSRHGRADGGVDRSMEEALRKLPDNSE